MVYKKVRLQSPDNKKVEGYSPPLTLRKFSYINCKNRHYSFNFGDYSEKFGENKKVLKNFTPPPKKKIRKF